MTTTTSPTFTLCRTDPSRGEHLAEPRASGTSTKLEDSLSGTVERAQAGDADAFAELVERHGRDAYRLAAAILGPEQAADATQEALLSAWRELPRLRQPDRFLPWLRRLTANRCRDMLRRAKRRIDPLPLEGETVNSHADTRSQAFEVTLEHRAVLDTAFESLTPEQRTLVALHYTLDLSIRDAARTLGIPVGTAKSRLNAALRALRTALATVEAPDDAA